MPKLGTAATALLTATLAATPLDAETLVLGHGYQPSHALAEHGITPWMACVEERSAGEISFQHFPSAQVVSHDGAVDALNQGLAQVAMVIVAYASEKLPLNGIPFLPDMGTTAHEMNTAYRRMLDAGGPLADEFAANGLTPIFVNLLPAYQIMSTVGPIDTPEKFAGLKVRVSGGSPTLMAEALGARPVAITGADMYVAMQRHTVDATFLTLSSAKPYGLPELINATSSNGAFGTGASVLAIDTSTFEGLPADERGALVSCGLEFEESLTTYVDEANEAMKAEYAEQGIEVFEFSPEVLAVLSEEMAGVADAYVARLEARGLPAGEALRAYRAALRQ